MSDNQTAVGAANGSTSGVLRQSAQARTSRRNMLRRGGVVAAASVAGLTLLDQRRAEADTGANFVLGNPNDASNPTALSVHSAGTTLVPLFHIDGTGLSGTSTSMIVDGPGSVQGIALTVNGNAGGTGIITSAANGPQGTTGLALAASGSNGADAIHAASDKGSAVAGSSTSGRAVTGTSHSGAGVVGTSATGTGVIGSGKRGGSFAGSAAAISHAPHAGSHPTSGTRGDLFVDHNTHLWFCRGGTAWVKLA
jgi:hypothetical protein